MHLTFIFGFLIFRGPRRALFLLLLLLDFSRRAQHRICLSNRRTPNWLPFTDPKHLKGISFNFGIDYLGHFQIEFQILLGHKRIIFYWNRDIIILKFLFIFIIIVEIINLYFLCWWMFCLCHPWRKFGLAVIILILKDVLIKLKSLDKSFIFCFLVGLSLGFLWRASLGLRL